MGHTVMLDFCTSVSAAVAKCAAAVVPSCPRTQFCSVAGVVSVAGVISLYPISSAPIRMKPAVGIPAVSVTGIVVEVDVMSACNVPNSTDEFPDMR